MSEMPFKCKLVKALCLKELILNNLILNCHKPTYKIDKFSKLEFYQDDGTPYKCRLENALTVSQAGLYEGVAYLHIHLQSYSNKILIYCHGKSSSMISNAGMMEDFVFKMGVDVVTFDYTLNERGLSTQHSLGKDVLTIYKLVSEKLRYSNENIIVMGFSLGSVPSSVLACSQKLAAQILLAPIASFYSVVSGTEDQFQGEDQLNNLERIEKTLTKTLFVHARHDMVVPFSNSRKLMNRMKTNCTLLEIQAEGDEGPSHSGLLGFIMRQVSLQNLIGNFIGVKTN